MGSRTARRQAGMSTSLISYPPRHQPPCSSFVSGILPDLRAAGGPFLQLRTAAALHDPAASIRELLQQLLGERRTRLWGRAWLSPGGRSFPGAGGRRLRSGDLGLPRARPAGRVGAVRQVILASGRQGDAPVAAFPRDRDQAPVLQCLARGLVGAGFPHAGRAPGAHPLQHRKLPLIDLPFQRAAFDSKRSVTAACCHFRWSATGDSKEFARMSGPQDCHLRAGLGVCAGGAFAVAVSLPPRAGMARADVCVRPSATELRAQAFVLLLQALHALLEVGSCRLLRGRWRR